MTKYWASHVTFCCHTLVQRIDFAAALTFAPGLLYTPGLHLVETLSTKVID